MKRFTINDIRSWQPCYDPARHLPENWTGDAVAILNHPTIPVEDKLWVVLRTDLVSEKLMRLFAVWCARQVVRPDADERTLFVLEFTEAYAENYSLVDDQDYRDMWENERSAAWSAAWSAAAWSAAAWSAAASAAWSAATSAAWSAAARSAAWSAAASAAWSAAASAARSAQIAKLRKMILAGIKTGDTK